MPTDPPPVAPRRPALHRSERGKMVAGVCVGLSETFGLPAWAFRLMFIVGNFLPGPGLFVYAILWVVMPLRREP